MVMFQKPTLDADWDDNRFVVVNHLGRRFVLGQERAEEVYETSMRIYRKLKREGRFDE